MLYQIQIDHIDFEDTCGISTAYLILSKVIDRGSKGRTIPFFLFWLTSLVLPTLDEIDLEETLLPTSLSLSAYYR